MTPELAALRPGRNDRMTKHGGTQQDQGGGFGRMGGKKQTAGGYGELAATAEEGPPVEEAGAGSYGGAVPQAGEDGPGGYGELAASGEDEDEDAPQINN